MKDNEQITLRAGTSNPVKATPLLVSEELRASGGDALSVKFTVPAGAAPARFAFVLVKLDD